MVTGKKPEISRYFPIVLYLFGGDRLLEAKFKKKFQDSTENKTTGCYNCDIITLKNCREETVRPKSSLLKNNLRALSLNAGKIKYFFNESSELIPKAISIFILARISVGSEIPFFLMFIF